MENLVQELGVLRNEVEKLRNTIDLNMNLLISRTDNVIKKVNEEPKKCRLVRFNIEKAKQGAKIVTRGGSSVRILCYDYNDPNYPIVAEVTHVYGTTLETYSEDGNCCDRPAPGWDLVIKEEC